MSIKRQLDCNDKLNEYLDMSLTMKAGQKATHQGEVSVARES